MATRTILSMAKDEGPFLLHWIAHHRLIGFDRIIVFTNDCSDGTDAMLDRLQALGEVIHHRNPVEPGGKPQPRALRAAEKLTELHESTWILPLDIDEYVRIKVGNGKLDDLFATAQDADGFALTWRMMGSNGHVDWTDLPVTEAYPKGAPDMARRGWGVKTLFKPFDGFKLGIHRPTVRGPDKSAMAERAWVNGSAKPMTIAFKTWMWNCTKATLGYQHAEIAHYATQSREAFLRRSDRGNVNAKPDKYTPTYFAVFDRNEEVHDGLSKLADATRRRVSGYLADRDLARLQAASDEWHANARGRLRSSPNYADRMAALAEAAATPYADLNTLLFLQPLGKPGAALVARLRAKGLEEAEIAKQVAHAVSVFEAQRDASDAAELRELGVVPDHMD